jgi:hypothetical protein
MTMTMPGFTADLALERSPAHYRGASVGSPRAGDEITPAAHGIECHIGHCGCYLDDWFGASCLCCEYW